jgi:hypothetical protein
MTPARQTSAARWSSSNSIGSTDLGFDEFFNVRHQALITAGDKPSPPDHAPASAGTADAVQ